MNRIVRLTESDLARIVKRVISEGTIPQKEFFIDENYSSFPDMAQCYIVTSMGAGQKLDYKKITGNSGVAFQVAVSGTKYVRKEGSWQISGAFNEQLQHVCGTASNYWIRVSKGGIKELQSGTPGEVSKMAGSLQNLSNNWCKANGVATQRNPLGVTNPS
jgi:hypothetical protein